jgi:hypothetical protein
VSQPRRDAAATSERLSGWCSTGPKPPGSAVVMSGILAGGVVGLLVLDRE